MCCVLRQKPNHRRQAPPSVPLFVCMALPLSAAEPSREPFYAGGSSSGPTASSRRCKAGRGIIGGLPSLRCVRWPGRGDAGAAWSTTYRPRPWLASPRRSLGCVWPLPAGGCSSLLGFPAGCDGRAVAGDDDHLGKLVRLGSAQVAMACRPIRWPAPLVSVSAVQHSFDLHQLLIVSGIALVIMVVPAIAAGWLVAGRLLRPLRAMTTAARNISATSLHERLNLSGPGDELKQLAYSFHDLLGRLDRLFHPAPIHRQRLARTSRRPTMRVWIDRAGQAGARAAARGRPRGAAAPRLYHVAGFSMASYPRPRSAALGRQQFDPSAHTIVSAATTERATLISGKSLDVRHQQCPAARVTGSEPFLARMVGNVVDPPSPTHAGRLGSHQHRRRRRRRPPGSRKRRPGARRA